MADDQGDIVLPVPELIEAIYLVPLTGPLDDPVALLRGLLPGEWEDPPFGPMLEEMLAESMPAEVHPVGDLAPLPLRLLEVFGATPDQLARARDATHLFMSRGGGRPGWPPLHEWVTRALAIMVAEHNGSDVIDVHDVRIRTTAKARRALPQYGGETTMAEWVSVTYSADSNGYWVTTTGLQRLGLPELQTIAVPPGIVETWGRTMTGLALRLAELWNETLDRHQDEAFVPFPNLVSMTAAHVAQAYARETPEGDDKVQLRLTLDPGNTIDARHPFLTVHPPLSWRGSAGEYLTHVCSQLYGAPKREVRHAHRTPAMEEAIAAARAGIDDIRSRFESGALGLHQKLLVKYRLEAPQGRELLWAYVTSWRDPDRILATSANDALYHPNVRLGRPVVVDAATIVDWAVEHDERGLVEGGFTQAVLDTPPLS